MAKRYCGEVAIRITYRDQGDYAGTVSVNGYVWHFDELRAPQVGFGPGIGYDSPQAYDLMAQSAVAFGAYYTTHNRGSDTPEWAPAPEVADAIDHALESDDRDYVIRRRPMCTDTHKRLRTEMRGDK